MRLFSNIFLFGFAIFASSSLAMTNCKLIAQESNSPWNVEGATPHLAVHYMPWFLTRNPDGENADWRHWNWKSKSLTHDPAVLLENNLRDIAAVHYPLIGVYNSWSEHVVRYHLETARAAGVQILIVNWYGPDRYEDRPVQILLDQAQELGMRICLCFEEKVCFDGARADRKRTEIVEDLKQHLLFVLESYGDHEAYLKRNGVPYICQFNYQASKDNPVRGLTAEELANVLAEIGPDRLIYGRGGLDADFHPAVSSAFAWWTFDFEHLKEFSRYAIQLKEDKGISFFLSCVCPGFDDGPVEGWGGGRRSTERDGLTVFRKTMELALVGEPEIIQVVTWNDFQEGTTIEPTREYGFRYIDELERWWASVSGRPVDLEDNRNGYCHFCENCQPHEKAELPKSPLNERLLRVWNEDMTVDKIDKE